MELYRKLRRNFVHILNTFRYGLFISDVLSGGILFLAFGIAYLLFFYFVASFFPLTVLFKGILYLVFWIGLFLIFVLFFIFPIFRFLSSLRLRNDRLFRRMQRLNLIRKDIFYSLYQLAIHPEKVTGDTQLKRAAFVQKYQALTEDHSLPVYSRRLIFQKSLLFILLLTLGFLNFQNFSGYYTDLRNYERTDNSKSRVRFYLQNSTLNAEYGKPFRLKLQVLSNRFSPDYVFICYGGGEFLMEKSDSLYVYDFDMVNNDIRFFFKTLGSESDWFKIHVLPTPEIKDYKITSFPPRYTGIKPEVLKNVVDFQALYGSTLKFEIDFSNIDSLYLENQGKKTLLPLVSDSKTTFSRVIKHSGEFSLYGSNQNFTHKNLLNFSVTCIPDLYPGIQVTEMQDSLRNSVYYFYGIITDDYGFSDLRFNYAVNGQNTVVMPITVAKGVNTQEFYFSFDFAEFAGMEKSKIQYYFEVFDNDEISGPKSSRTDSKSYAVPDLNTIFDYNIQANDQVNHALSEVEKLAQEIVTGVKDLQKKMLDNSVDNWEKQQLSKDIVEKKNKLDQLLKKVQENNLKKSALNKSFTKQDSVLISKQQQIQDLLDKVMDEDMKKLMEEFSRLSQEFSKDQFQQLDEKMKLSFDQMSEELDRNIELLKRFQLEERHGLISEQVQQLKAAQEKFNQMKEDRSVSSDSLSNLGEELRQKWQDIQNNYQNLLKDNEQLSAPYDLKKDQELFDQLSQHLEQQKENASTGKEDEKLSKEIEEEIEEVAQQMEEQKQKNFNDKSLPESDIELIIQNILIISLSQEELLHEFSQVSSQSGRYSELGRLQDLKRQEYKIVKDSLSELAKSNLMLASLLSDKFYDLEVKFGLLPQYIQNNRRGELAQEQQFIISYLNDIALSLSEALQKSQQQQKGSKSGQGNKKGSKKGGEGDGKSQGDKQDGYGQLKKFQNSIKKQLEDLVSQMKRGEKGKPLQQGISNMIRENELFRKSLNDFISESGSLSNAEKQLLNEINRLLEENIRDMANYSVHNQLIQRNNQIYNKLLMSEKAAKEREEYEDKRRSETAKEMNFKRPQELFDHRKKTGMLKTDFRKSDIKLNNYFKTMYNNYYIKLGNE